MPLILNQNIKVGNSLIGAKPGDARLDAHADALAELYRLRWKLAADPDVPHADTLATIDALRARVNRALNADEYLFSFAHILETFPRVFADDEQGKAKRATLLDLMLEL